MFNIVREVFMGLVEIVVLSALVLAMAAGAMIVAIVIFHVIAMLVTY